MDFGGASLLHAYTGSLSPSFTGGCRVANFKHNISKTIASIEEFWSLYLRISKALLQKITSCENP